MIDFFERLLRALALHSAATGEACHQDTRTTRQALRVLVNLRELAETIGWTALVWFGDRRRESACDASFSSCTLDFRKQYSCLAGRWWVHWCQRPVALPAPFTPPLPRACYFSAYKKETAAALSIVLHLVDFGPAVLFGLFYVIRGDLSLSKLRAMISPQRASGRGTVIDVSSSLERFN